MANPKKMPNIDRYQEIRERDARAIAIMEERGCSFSEAWLAAEPPAKPTRLITRCERSQFQLE